MNYILNPSQEDARLAEIAVQLWTEDDDLAASIKSYLEDYSYRTNIYAKMSEKVETVQLPTHSKTQLASFIRPIGKQIYHWYFNLHLNYKTKVINPRDLRWTSSGTIDQVKSVQLLLRDQSLSLKQRFRLACTFCLVEQVQDLSQREILNENELPVFANSNPVRADDQDLVDYFTLYLKPRVFDFNKIPVAYLSPYHEACHVAIVSRNSVATKYFFQRLNREEKNLIFSAFRVQFIEINYASNLVDFPLQFSADLVCFLLSQMSESQREELLRTTALCVLKVLVVWPYARHFLLETVNRMREFLRESDFEHLVYSILAQIDKSLTNCEYRAMFLELWRLSSVQHRTYFVNRVRIMTLYEYFNKGEVEVCKMLLSEASAERKERMILEDRSLPSRYYSLASQQLRNYFQFFIEECGTPRDVIVRYKTQLTAHVAYVESEESREFLQFLDTFHPQQTE